MAFDTKPNELLDFKYSEVPKKPWLKPWLDFHAGNYIYPAKPNILEYLNSKALPGEFPNAREWSPIDEDWKFPENWRETIKNGFRERLEKYRSFKVFLDICVRCGACADKCHYYIGGGDPKNMPVMRAELLRSIYRGEFTTAGKILGKMAGARKLDEDVVKEWFLYFYQCTECRRCSLFCPYGIDTAEITMMGRELLHLVGCNINWALEPVANCNRTGNHLGIQPHAFKDMVEFFCDDIEEITGVKIEPPINERGHEIIFITPSGDVFADPGTYTFMGYLMLFHELGLDYTLSTYASEGGNFGLFTSHDMMKKLNAKMYYEAERLGCKWIIGGECGHMWRVINQYMDTMTGPGTARLGPEPPKSPITGTVFENAASCKMVHITEFTSDLIYHNKIKLEPSRNDDYVVTFHDSCNPSRGMGLFEEPRYVLKHAVKEFHEMPEDSIKEKTFCCAGGAGLGTDEFMEMRMRGGLPRGNALRFVQNKHGVNMMACICAIDRATLIPLAQYWAPGVDICGIHELVGNALVMKGEKERELNLRSEPLGG
jgi:Fe-S oxidoreductase